MARRFGRFEVKNEMSDGGKIRPDDTYKQDGGKSSTEQQKEIIEDANKAGGFDDFDFNFDQEDTKAEEGIKPQIEEEQVEFDIERSEETGFVLKTVNGKRVDETGFRLISVNGKRIEELTAAYQNAGINKSDLRIARETLAKTKADREQSATHTQTQPNKEDFEGR